MDKNEYTLTVGKIKAAEKTEPEKQEIYTINDVSKMLGVHQQTLRNWERKKLVVPLRAGSRRIYTAVHLDKCRKIKEFSGRGISLKGIKELLNMTNGG